MEGTHFYDFIQMSPHPWSPLPYLPLGEHMLRVLCCFVHQSVSCDEPGHEAHTYQACVTVSSPYRNLLRAVGALCWAPGLFEHCHQTGEIKTGEEQEPVAHLWLWAVFPGLKPVPHSPPVPFIIQCLVESQKTLAPVLPLDGPKSPTMPRGPQSLLPSQPLAPDTVSQQRGSRVNTSHHSCQAKVGPSYHSRSPGDGEMESLGRC